MLSNVHDLEFLRIYESFNSYGNRSPVSLVITVMLTSTSIDFC